MSYLPPNAPAPQPYGSYGTPPAWSPPPGWPGPGWNPAAPARRSGEKARWLGTFVVAAVIAVVVLGGIGLDAAIAAPSAGTVVIAGSVTLTAAPGWVLAASQDPASGVQLQKSDAILAAEVVASGYSGGSASMLADQQSSLTADTAQISYGDVHTTTISGHDTTFVVFEATVASDQGSGVVDGELVCMVVQGYAVVIVVDARQGDLDPMIDDISAMLVSIEAGR